MESGNIKSQLELANSPERTVEELEADPQPGSDLPWPPPPGWKWHDIGVKFRRDLAGVEKALARFSGDAVQRQSLEARRRHLAAKLNRWKKVVFFSGWRAGQDRET